MKSTYLIIVHRDIQLVLNPGVQRDGSASRLHRLNGLCHAVRIGFSADCLFKLTELDPVVLSLVRQLAICCILINDNVWTSALLARIPASDSDV